MVYRVHLAEPGKDLIVGCFFKKLAYVHNDSLNKFLARLALSFRLNLWLNFRFYVGLLVHIVTVSAL